MCKVDRMSWCSGLAIGRGRVGALSKRRDCGEMWWVSEQRQIGSWQHRNTKGVPSLTLCNMPRRGHGQVLSVPSFG